MTHDHSRPPLVVRIADAVRGVTLLGCWLGYQVNWIRERHEVLSDPRLKITWVIESEPIPHAPGVLWLFGETGVAEIEMRCNPAAAAIMPDEEDRWHLLFPEASFQWEECG